MKVWFEKVSIGKISRFSLRPSTAKQCQSMGSRFLFIQSTHTRASLRFISIHLLNYQVSHRCYSCLYVARGTQSIRATPSFCRLFLLFNENQIIDRQTVIFSL